MRGHLREASGAALRALSTTVRGPPERWPIKVEKQPLRPAFRTPSNFRFGPNLAHRGDLINISC
jgi:hypothetical protein